MPHASSNFTSASSSWSLPQLAPNVTLAGGTLAFQQPLETDEDNAPGMKLVLVLNGEIGYRVPGSAAVEVCGPALHVALSNTPFTIHHRYGAADPLRYISVRMPLDSLAAIFETDKSFLARGLGRADVAQWVVDSAASKAVQRLGQQMLACPLEGAMRKLYLSGKALELTAAAMAEMQLGRGHSHGSSAARAQPSLASRDRDCLQHARALLLADLQNPPTLVALARTVGINVSKLTAGFRQLFGCSVYGFVRHERMEQAFRMLSAGEISVADAAHACGYTDSHFSKVFRQRFGLAPSSLRN